MGFDIIIANPPYGADYPEIHKKYFKENYECTKNITGKQKGSLNTFALFIEKGVNLLKEDGNLIFIVAISVISSDSMSSLHKFLKSKCKLIKVSSYATRPQPIFENAMVNTSIIELVKRQHSDCKIYTTKMYRKDKNHHIEDILNNLEFIEINEFELQGRYPKISKSIEKKILKKIFSQDKSIFEIIRNDGKPIYYRFAGGRYYKIITNYSTSSSAERVMFLYSKVANSTGAILSSNLFFWFYQIYSDNLNLKSTEIELFKIPYSKLTNDVIKQLESVYEAYLNDIEANAKTRNAKEYANIDSFKEYKIRKSKHLIDKIDDIIGPLYGLTEVEIEFIKNYEIEFRSDDN